MEFSSFSEFARAVAEGRLLGGDVVYVSPALYAALSHEDRAWLWRQSLDARVQLVTDLEVEPGIRVRRRAADG